jgi:hypothetical protein
MRCTVGGQLTAATTQASRRCWMIDLGSSSPPLTSSLPSIAAAGEGGNGESNESRWIEIQSLPNDLFAMASVEVP